MMNTLFQSLQTILIFAIPVLFAITLHEFAHGWIANKRGDPTARILGRLTLNPLKHIDLFGTVIVPALLYYTTGMLFGWAKPVPVNVHNLRNPNRDFAWVAIAGPAANLIMALIWVILLKIGTVLSHIFDMPPALSQMAYIGLLINLLLMFLNLLPIPPLDGSRVVSSILPPRWGIYYRRLEPFGIIILLILILTGFIGNLLSPAITGFSHLLLSLIQISH